MLILHQSGQQQNQFPIIVMNSDVILQQDALADFSKNGDVACLQHVDTPVHTHQGQGRAVVENASENSISTSQGSSNDLGITPANGWREVFAAMLTSQLENISTPGSYSSQSEPIYASTVNSTVNCFQTLGRETSEAMAEIFGGTSITPAQTNGPASAEPTSSALLTTDKCPLCAEHIIFGQTENHMSSAHPQFLRKIESVSQSMRAKGAVSLDEVYHPVIESAPQFPPLGAFLGNQAQASEIRFLRLMSEKLKLLQQRNSLLACHDNAERRELFAFVRSLREACNLPVENLPNAPKGRAVGPDETVRF